MISLSHEWIPNHIIVNFVEASKEEEVEDIDDMGSFDEDDEDEDADASDKEMGVDAEDGDEASSARHKKFAEQVCYILCILINEIIE